MNSSSSSNRPLISVVLPTRNRAHLLPRAIASVLGQTYRNLELIVVNDASTDATAEVLAGIGDPRLRVIHREVNKGAAAARNAGIADAVGEFVSFQDDDDYWLVQKLEKQVAALMAPGQTAGWCLSSYIRLEPGTDMYIGGPWYISQLDYSKGIGRGGPDWSLIATPGWLVRRSLLQETGAFDERIRSWDDWELGLRLWARGGKPVVVDEPLWCQDWLLGSGLTRAERARGNDMRIFMAVHGGVWANSRRVTARHWYVAGRLASMYEQAPAGRALLWRSARIWPFDLRTWSALGMSYLGQQRAHDITTRYRALRESLK